MHFLFWYTINMFNHASLDYKCPICLGVQGIENDDTLLKQSDLIYKNGLVSVFINSFFLKGNEGHLIVVPNKHFENIYDLDTETGSEIMKTAQTFSVVLKQAYHSDGITLMQNNEPGADQHAFHFHLHLFPRYKDDKFDQAKRYLSTSAERINFKLKLQKYLDY